MILGTTFIYALCEPASRVVRYIGKTDKPKKRIREHRACDKRCRSTRKIEWVRSLLRSGRHPEFIVIDEVPSDNWQHFERYYIQQAKDAGFDLFNLTPGGDGFGAGEDHPWHGGCHSAEVKARISAAHKGRSLSDATKEKLRELALLRRHTVETRAKISAAGAGVPKSESHKLKIKAALTGKSKSAEHRAKLRASRLAFLEATKTL